MGPSCERSQKRETASCFCDRRQVVGALAGDAQELAARAEQRDSGAGGEKLRQLGCGLQQVLEVVEQQQHLLSLKMRGESLEGALSRLFPEAQGVGDRGHHQRRVSQGAEEAAEDAVAVVGEALLACPAASSSEKRVLPCPPGPVTVSRRVSCNSASASYSSLLSAQEGGGRRGQVGIGDRLQRREGAIAELVDHDRPLRCP